MRKIIILSLITLFIGMLLLIIFHAPTNANVDKVTICHCERPIHGDVFQCQTLHLSEEGAHLHLTNHPHDYAGECKVDEKPTPTVSVSATPTPKKECNEDEDCVIPSLTPIATPSATPTVEITASPTVPPAGHGDGLSDGRSDGRSDGLCSKPPCVTPNIPKGAPATGRG